MLKIKNVLENNLKNISIDIPLHQITSVIGISGSGKSSLIYDVIANEAKRREKIDSGNANCFDYAIRPNFESISNLPYCITLKQRGLQQSISSTLATVTKLHELLRDEFVKYGKIIGDNGNIIAAPSINTIEEYIQKYYTHDKSKLFAVVCFKKKTNGKKELELLKKYNIQEAIFISSFDDKEKIKTVATVKSLNENFKQTILVPVKKKNDSSIYQNIALESFLYKGNKISLNFGFDYPDIETGKIYQKKSTQLLSFNASNRFSGKCEYCNGHGLIEDLDFNNLIIKNKNLNEYFLNLEDNGKGAYKYVNIRPSSIEKELRKQNINLNQSYYDLSEDEKQIIIDMISPKILKHQAKPSIGKFIKTQKCPMCNGTRLNYKANAVKLYGVSISDILRKTVDELYDFLKDKEIHHKKILTILKALQKVTLGYLTLDRTTDTLSGGELQRLKFALELNSEYKNLLYILDEPSTGLHPYNNHQMIHLIKNLRDKGNTVIISEHNDDYIKASDYVVELGYGSGQKGGEVIFQGKNKISTKEDFKRTKLVVNLENSIKLNGVTANNIVNEDFIIPLNCLVSISGISGSGKSSLIHKVLVPTIKQYIADKTIDNSLVKNIDGIENIKSIVELTQSQIGLNSRSIVATYLNIFDKIREIYADMKIAKEFNLDKGYFSFNSDGACNTCKGLGEVDERLCTSCLGQRYKPEILDIRYKELNIANCLENSIEELLMIFDDEKLQFSFSILKKLGLSHITLGRTTPTLSGGEAQRLKLAKTLIESFTKIKKGDFLFILDEPTTGLSNKDTTKIYSIFDEILAYGNSIIIIEHNLEIIKNSDFIIDIGIGSGKDGGKNLFSGSYDELLQNKISLTAKAFQKNYDDIEHLNIDTSNLKEKIYENKKTPNCNKFYLDDKHFNIEKKFAKYYKVLTDNKNHKYFKTKEKLFDFVNSLTQYEISFNPYVTELYKYKTIPISIKKEKLKRLKKLGFKITANDYKIPEWDYRIEVDDIQQAYNFGNGWITVKDNNNTYELFTRLVTVKNKIVGMPAINTNSFNLYLNSCIYCEGKGIQDSFDIDLIIKDKNKSVIDDGFFHSNIKIPLKSIVSKFQKEGLFDFTKPYSRLSKEEVNIFLYGFKEYKFLKPKGRVHAITDYIRWQGIYSYISNDFKKINIANEIKASKSNEICPFCEIGFKKEIIYYTLDDNSIIDIIKKDEKNG